MIMVLMDLAVNCCLRFLVTLLYDALVGDSWGNFLVDGGIVVTGLVPTTNVSN